MKKSFKRDWMLYNSLASIISMGTLFFYPLFVTISVVTVQVVILKKHLGWRAALWILNPFLMTFGLVISAEHLLVGILLSSLMLEFVFFITIGRFSNMIWTLIIGIPFTLSSVLFTIFGFENIFVLIFGALLFTTLLWVMEAFYLDTIIKKIILKDEITNPEIIDI
tara:strand:+ start:257 stop:754 length:498 start_codon:yes stop_codon:yes gene_type:complete